MSKLENEIQNKLTKIAQNHPEIALLDRSNSGKIKAKGGWVQLHQKGFPDVCGFTTAGQFIGIEFKRPETKSALREGQKDFRDLMQRNNAIHGIAWDEESLLQILDNIV